MIKYGAYDPLYPNGIMSVGRDGELFGIRFLVYNREEKRLLDADDFDFRKIRIGKMSPERYYEMQWEAFGKTVRLIWARAADSGISGRIEADDETLILIEMYTPRAYCLQKEWVNFTGEMCGRGTDLTVEKMAGQCGLPDSRDDSRKWDRL